MSASGIRWADSSSDESSDDEAEMQQMQPAGLNFGSIQAYSQGGETAGESQQTFIPQESATRDESVSDDEKHELSDSESEGEETDEEERERRGEILQKVREEAEAKKQAEAEAKRKLTKKEQQALKAKELHDIDALMNEFGVANEEEKPAPLPVLVSSPKMRKLQKPVLGGRKKRKIRRVRVQPYNRLTLQMKV